MRQITKYVGLIALVAGARYVPLERTADVVAWLVKPPAPAGKTVVTGSVDKDKDSAGAAPVAQAAGPRRRNVEDDVRTILAQAKSEQQRSGGGTNQNSDGTRARGKRDDSDGIYTGGTGLLDDVEVVDKENPLAAANPDDYLVICEAGCRPANDRIVYRVSKIAAASAVIAQRRLEVTAAEPKDDNAEAAGVVCVAGCYDEEPVAKKKHAEQPEKSSIKLAEVEERAPPSKLAAASTALKDESPKPVAQTPEASTEIAQAIPATVGPDGLANKSSESPVAVALTGEPKKEAPDVPLSAAQPVEGEGLASAHLISAETQAHMQAKRAKLAMAPPSMPAVRVAAPTPLAPNRGWRTRVTSILALPRSDAPKRSVVAIAPFATSVSVENGWEWNLVNTQ